MSSVSPSSQAPKPMDAAAVKVGDSSPKKVPRKAKIIAREKITKILGGKNKTTAEPTEAKPRSFKRKKQTKEADVTTHPSSTEADTAHAISGEPAVVGIIGAYSANEGTAAAVAQALDVKALKAVYKQKEQELYSRRSEEENFLEYIQLKLQIDRKEEVSGSVVVPYLSAEERFQLLQSRYETAGLPKEKLLSLQQIKGLESAVSKANDKELVTVLQMIKQYCPALTALKVSVCVLPDEALDEISQMTQLTIVSISKTLSLSNLEVNEKKLGEVLKRLSKLESFSLKYLDVKGSFLQSLSPVITKLDLIFAARSEFEAQNVDFSRFTKLLSLGTSYIPFTVESIATLPASLKEFILDYSSATATDVVLSHLSQSCPHLESLEVIGNFSITGDFFDTLPLTLQKLKIDQCQITDANLAKLEHHRLVELRVERSQGIRGDRFSKLPDSLQIVEFTGCRVSDENIAHLRRLKALSEVTIVRNNDLSGTCFAELPRTIKKANFEDCPVTDQAMKGLFQGNNCLEELRVANSSVTGKYVSEHAPKTLRVLNVSLCEQLDDEALGDLSAFNSLTHFFARATPLTGRCLKKLPECLQELDLTRCLNLDQKELVALLRFSQLRLLFIDGNFKIDLTFCKYLLNNIEVLYCGGNNGMVDEAIAHLAAQPKLRELGLMVNLITKEQLLALPESLELLVLLPVVNAQPLREQRPHLRIVQVTNRWKWAFELQERISSALR